MKYAEFRERFTAIESQILEARRQHDPMPLYEARATLEAELKRRYFLGYLQLPHAHGEVEVEVVPGAEIGIRMCVQFVEQRGLGRFDIYEYMPAVSFSRLATIREILDRYESGELDELPMIPPWGDLLIN